MRTGASGRVWLAVDDGSVIKLGQQTRFALIRAEFRSDGDATLLDAAFDVLKGAFRFTSGFFTAKRAARHRIDIGLGAITVGIRGTDIWGRAGDDEDFVALLEGRIEVGAEGDPREFMDQPLTLYAKKRGQPASGLQSVELATVQNLAPETELDAENAIASSEGRFDLVLMSLQRTDLVESNLQRFREAGYPATAVPAVVDDAEFTRLLLRGLTDRAAAGRLAVSLQQQFGLAGVWIVEAR